MSLLKQLTELKEDINQSKIEEAGIQGQLTQLENKLEEDYGIKIDGIVDLIAKKNKQQTRISEAIEKSVNRINEEFDLELVV